MPSSDVYDIILVLINGSFTVSLSPGTPHLRNGLVQAFSGGTFSSEFKEYSASSWCNAITWLHYPLLPAGQVHETFCTKLVFLLIFRFTFFKLALQQHLARKKWSFLAVQRVSDV